MSKLQRREEIAGYLFLMPHFIGLCIFAVIPMIASLFLGFTEWNPARGLDGITFTGLDNFRRMLTDTRVHISLRNNIIYSFTYVPISISIGLVLAVALNRFIYLKVPIRLMIFMPHISSLVSVSVVWMVLLFPRGGPVNAVLTNVFGVTDPPMWFASSTWALPGLIIMGIWRDVGYYMIILLAGLQNIPHQLYEAASIDGANGLKRFFKITIPMLSPTIFFASILATILSFRIFDQINIITRGGPGRATNVLVYTLFTYAFHDHRFGYASAIAILLFAITLTLSLIQMKLRKRLSL
jgi:ABC-type sugar transport system permease subunit